MDTEHPDPAPQPQPQPQRAPLFGGLSFLAIPAGLVVGVIVGTNTSGMAAAVAGLLVGAVAAAGIGVLCLVLSRLNNERYAPLAVIGAAIGVLPLLIVLLGVGAQR
ncbi:hypothetical protein [Xanthomonas maliensis]|uniref:hypothetical protein n=1 Tax=Xanthomonas maliensis TaxID=1321368 RepID=UPI0003B3B282|nr:hypothetical protein [Xanthomonas maliensis]KAB7772550.1 hypothetical protein CKY51_00085 [Xanthomonas maliensis]